LVWISGVFIATLSLRGAVLFPTPKENNQIDAMGDCWPYLLWSTEIRGRIADVS
jgi:hypothetical protein